MESVLNILQAVLGIVNEMSPYLLLGFLLAGIMHAFIPDGWYTKYLSGDTFRSVVNAAIFGVPLPLCSCGVIPTAMSLRREGASKGAVVSFLIATPHLCHLFLDGTSLCCGASYCGIVSGDYRRNVRELEWQRNRSNYAD